MKKLIRYIVVFILSIPGIEYSFGQCDGDLIEVLIESVFVGEDPLSWELREQLVIDDDDTYFNGYTYEYQFEANNLINITVAQKTYPDFSSVSVCVNPNKLYYFYIGGAPGWNSSNVKFDGTELLNDNMFAYNKFVTNIQFPFNLGCNIPGDDAYDANAACPYIGGSAHYCYNSLCGWGYTNDTEETWCENEGFYFSGWEGNGKCYNSYDCNGSSCGDDGNWTPSPDPNFANKCQIESAINYNSEAVENDCTDNSCCNFYLWNESESFNVGTTYEIYYEHQEVDFIPWEKLQYFTFLEDLNLRGNNLTIEDIDNSKLSKLVSLKGVNLDQNQLSGTIADGLYGLFSLVNLERIYLGGNNLTGEIPIEFGSMANLKQLHLWQNNLTGEIPGELGYSTSLEWLNLNENDLQGTLDVILGWEDMPNLEGIELHGNGLFGGIPINIGDSWLGSSNKLSTLGFNSNNLGCADYDYSCVPEGDWDQERCCITHCDETDECSAGIPSSIGNLNSLEYLYLGANYLRGEIPEEIGNLTNLQVLHLDNNRIASTIPERIGDMSSLRVLGLDQNDLYGEVPIQINNLSKLEALYLYNNHLTGTFPEIDNMSSLRRLQIFDNYFDYIPESFCDIDWGGYVETEWGEEEIYLDISNNRLCAESDYDVVLNMYQDEYPDCIEEYIVNQKDCLYCLTPDGQGLQKEVSLLGQCVPAYVQDINWVVGETEWLDYPLEGDAGGQLEGIKNLVDLRSLNLKDNNLTGHFPPLWQLKGLETLQLGGNELKGINFNNENDLPNLGFLALWGNQIENFDFETVYNLSNLSILEVQNNQIKGAMPNGISKLRNLIHLNIDGNELTDLPDDLCSLSLDWNGWSGDSEENGWRYFDASQNRICENDYPYCVDYDLMGEQTCPYCNGQEGEVELWGQCYNIDNTTEIIRPDASLQGLISDDICYLTNLVKIDLRNNELEGDIPDCITEDLYNLEEVWLGNNRFTGHINFDELINLRILELKNNALTGAIYNMFTSDLGNLEHLDLRWNLLEGDIGWEIGELKSLRYLNLQGNGFWGSIPSEIGTLDSLKVLSLGINHFEGEIPEEIYKLDLEWLDVYNNNLWGQLNDDICNIESVSVARNAFCPGSGGYPECIIGNIGHQNTVDCYCGSDGALCPDCAGKVGGDAIVDECGVCEGPGLNNCDQCGYSINSNGWQVATNSHGLPEFCYWVHPYIEGIDYEVLYDYNGSLEGCAFDCEQKGNCTAFEYSLSDNYCAFWFDGACDLLNTDEWNPPLRYDAVYGAGWETYIYTGVCDCYGSQYNSDTGFCGETNFSYPSEYFGPWAVIEENLYDNLDCSGDPESGDGIWSCSNMTTSMPFYSSYNDCVGDCVDGACFPSDFWEESGDPSKFIFHNDGNLIIEENTMMPCSLEFYYDGEPGGSYEECHEAFPSIECVDEFSENNGMKYTTIEECQQNCSNCYEHEGSVSCDEEQNVCISSRNYYSWGYDGNSGKLCLIGPDNKILTCSEVEFDDGYLILTEVDGGECLEFVLYNVGIYGCMDEHAENYNSEANIDDGSCYCGDGYAHIDNNCVYQENNHLLEGAWIMELGFFNEDSGWVWEPPAYILLDGYNGVEDVSSFNLDPDSHLGSYIINPDSTFELELEVKSDGNVDPIFYGSISSVGEVDINVNMVAQGWPIEYESYFSASLTKVQNEGALSGAWEGTIYISDYEEEIRCQIDDSGSINYCEGLNGTTSGHIFYEEPYLVGHIRTSMGDSYFEEISIKSEEDADNLSDLSMYWSPDCDDWECPHGEIIIQRTGDFDCVCDNGNCYDLCGQCNGPVNEAYQMDECLSEDEWVYCSGENDYCDFHGPRVIRYGTFNCDGEGIEAWNYEEDRDGAPCESIGAEDPCFGTYKYCYYSADCYDGFGNICACDAVDICGVCGGDNTSCVKNPEELLGSWEFNGATTFSNTSCSGNEKMEWKCEELDEHWENEEECLERCNYYECDGNIYDDYSDCVCFCGEENCIEENVGTCSNDASDYYGHFPEGFKGFEFEFDQEGLGKGTVSWPGENSQSCEEDSDCQWLETECHAWSNEGDQYSYNDHSYDTLEECECSNCVECVQTEMPPMVSLYCEDSKCYWDVDISWGVVEEELCIAFESEGGPCWDYEVNSDNLIFTNIDGEDGECEVSDFISRGVPGCMDETACNYRPIATSDDGSCIMPSYVDQYDVLCCEEQKDFCGDCSGENSCLDYPLEFSGSWYKLNESLFSDSLCTDTEEIFCEADSYDACQAEQFCTWNGDYGDDQSGTCMLEVMSPDILDLYLDGTYDFTIGCNSEYESCNFQGTEQWGLKQGELCYVSGEEGDNDWSCYSQYELNDGQLEVRSSKADRCHKIVYKQQFPGCMDDGNEDWSPNPFPACNYNASATINDGSCDYSLTIDSEGTECCSYLVDACGLCDGDNACMSDLTDSEYVGHWDFVGQNLYAIGTFAANNCAVPLDCSQLTINECDDYGCSWSGISCVVDENKFPSQIDLNGNGNYSILINYDRSCSENPDVCQLEFGDQFSCNVENGHCEIIVNNQWTADDEKGELCFRGTDDDIVGWNCMEASFKENELHLNASGTSGCGIAVFRQLVEGCTDEFAINYDCGSKLHPDSEEPCFDLVNIDDGSCMYPVYGCRDIEATNYNENATASDGSCIYPIPVSFYINNIDFVNKLIEIRYSSPIDIASYSFEVHGDINLDAPNIFGDNLQAGYDITIPIEITFNEIFGQVCIGGLNIDANGEDIKIINIGCVELVGIDGSIVNNNDEASDSSVEIPAGALDSPQVISVTSEIEDLSESIVNATGYNVDETVGFLPYNLDFPNDAPVTIELSNSTLSRSFRLNDLQLCMLDGPDDETWSVVESGDECPELSIGKACCDENGCKAEVTSFGIYALCNIEPDCNGVTGGNAYLDECETCVGGDTGKSSGIEKDECACCNGPGMRSYYPDIDGDKLGSGDPQLFCANAIPENYVSNSFDPQPSCATNDEDACNICAGDGSTCGASCNYTYFPDVDGDGIGAMEEGKDYPDYAIYCQKPVGWALNPWDQYPFCFSNYIDDCGLCDGPGYTTKWYKDDDGDSLGDKNDFFEDCGAGDEGYVLNDGDLYPDCITNDVKIYYADADGDGLGAGVGVAYCSDNIPSNLSDNNDDTEPECSSNDTDYCGKCSANELDNYITNDCIPNIINVIGPIENILSLHSGLIGIESSKSLAPMYIDSAIAVHSSLNGDIGAEINLSGDGSIIQLSLGQLTAGDTIHIFVDGTNIVSAEGSNYKMSHVYGDSTWSYTVELLGDYNHNLEIDENDIDTLITYWGNDSKYELGPCAGGLCSKDDLPYLTPAFDGQWDIEDLMTFALMWDWSIADTVARERIIYQIDQVGIEPKFEFEDNNLYLLYTEDNIAVHHVWFQIQTMEKDLHFEIADFNEKVDLVLNRSSAYEQSQEWSLISVNGNIDISKLLLGSFIINSKDGKDFKVQYKITNKSGNISSGYRDMMFIPLPNEFRLSQAYPNPFNPSTTIEFALPVDSEIMLSVYDLQGRIVSYLVQGLQPAGYHKAVWDGSQYASGLYFIRMDAYGLDNSLQFNQLQKIMLVK